MFNFWSYEYRSYQRNRFIYFRKVKIKAGIKSRLYTPRLGSLSESETTKHSGVYGGSEKTPRVVASTIKGATSSFVSLGKN